MSYLQRFEENVAHRTLSNKTRYEKRMVLLNEVMYGESKEIGEVDFSAFTVGDFEDAINDMVEYEPDELIESTMDQCVNLGNPIYEINCLAGIVKDVTLLKPQNRKRRTFF